MQEFFFWNRNAKLINESLNKWNCFSLVFLLIFFLFFFDQTDLYMSIKLVVYLEIGTAPRIS